MTRIFLTAVLILVFGAGASAGGEPMPASFEGRALVNSAGMTLYTFDRDTSGSGKSACNGPCAVNWPPLKADDPDQTSSDWSIVVRDDGSKQWAYMGMPLYLWAKDQKPGDRAGDGVNKVWHVVAK